MYLPTFLSLSVLALLQLGATQEFVILTRNQLREEIRAGVAAALSSSGNQSPSLLNFHRNSSCSCDGLSTLQEAVGRLQQQVNISTDAYSHILQEFRTLRRPGRSTSYPAISCREIKEGDPNSPSGYYIIQCARCSVYTCLW